MVFFIFAGIGGTQTGIPETSNSPKGVHFEGIPPARAQNRAGKDLIYTVNYI